MNNESLHNLMQKLQIEEGAESQLIWLYRTLLDMGVENCVEESEREMFRQNMSILHDESEIHKQMINELLTKY